MASHKGELTNLNEWCHKMAITAYITSALTVLAHVIWYVIDRNTMIFPPNDYPVNYIILPAIGLFVLDIFIGIMVRSIHVPLLVKEYISLMPFIVIPFYLSMTHNNVIVLLCLYIFPIVASSIFSNTRLTRNIQILSLVGLFIASGKVFIDGEQDREMIMAEFIISVALFSLYFLVRVLIQFGQSNLEAMKKSNEEAINNELAFCQAQINPHFLCNAINTIISICYTDGEKAAALLATMISYLQFTFDFNSKLMMVSLEKEIQLIKAYIEIEKARFGDLITVEYMIEPELFNLEIPSFCLQPLVENAIKHGVCKKENGGTVIITAIKEDDILILSVSDTGVGMSDGKRNRLIHCEDSSEGVGFYNVKRRVMGWKNAQFDIQSTEGAGTTVTMRISGGAA